MGFGHNRPQIMKFRQQYFGYL